MSGGRALRRRRERKQFATRGGLQSYVYISTYILIENFEYMNDIYGGGRE